MQARGCMLVGLMASVNSKVVMTSVSAHCGALLVASCMRWGGAANTWQSGLGAPAEVHRGYLWIETGRRLHLLCALVGRRGGAREREEVNVYTIQLTGLLTKNNRVDTEGGERNNTGTEYKRAEQLPVYRY